jgi:methylated-DNA-[protein]-cysteine S-methyltransferase
MLFQSSYSSPLGDIIILTNETHVLGLWFQDQKHFAAHYDLPAQPSERPLLDQTKDWLTDYFDGHEPDPANLPLAPAGTAFQVAGKKLPATFCLRTLLVEIGAKRH